MSCRFGASGDLRLLRTTLPGLLTVLFFSFFSSFFRACFATAGRAGFKAFVTAIKFYGGADRGYRTMVSGLRSHHHAHLTRPQHPHATHIG